MTEDQLIREDQSITPRDLFAAHALAGILAHQMADGSDFLHEAGPAAAAMWADRMADAMMKRRKSNAGS